ncbi:PEPxxWA-CTERM sorting domain-containing protein [Phenylobacterium sp.]|uniref:PEPxxWA-CTERM sorting domain-containing protein n=1 Tax=Phenylobacterium sp. TaxID=1871053 RepID=UPI0025DF45E1|nr:PEPxxWA-CTERM sorting domain-containing protein [Phenylobacterium sp.]MBX3484700.1 PEPxxWA-CTERM sorting domain-containing protein [Phenylobacterium sp.]MCW5759719.1 PEPxxWA-CTERM sorting domain-containing protein [Phenylobacterium sp.]
MRRVLLAAAGAVAAAAAAGAAQAAVIENTAGVFDASIAFYSPLGQTFTAIDTDLISIGFAYSNINPDSPNDPITLSLYAGEGVGGTLVASRVFTLPSVLPSTLDAPVIIDTDFSGVSLTLGAVYTAALSTSSFKVAVVYGDDAYAGGHALNSLSSCASCDLDFRVVGSSEPRGGVPEPATWALMLTGFAGLGARLRSRRRRAEAVQAA